MIGRKWKLYLIFISILGIAVFYIPELSLIGLIFPPVFFLLAFMPSVFIYSWGITIFLLLLKPAGKAKYILAPIITAMLFMAIPYHFNTIIDEEKNKFIKDDLSIKEPLPTGRTLALEIPSSHSIMGMNDNKCEAMCQTLLYNKVYQNISVKVNGGREYNYHLESRAKCPSLNNLLDGIAERVSNGECLIEDLEKKEIPDFVYRVEPISSSNSSVSRISLSATPINGSRLTVFDNRTSSPKELYRRTTLTSHPLRFPLMIGVGGGFQLNVHTEIYRTQITLNEPSQNEAENIFGSASLKAININPENAIKIIKSYLNNNSDATGTAYQLTNSYWNTLATQKSLTADDLDIIISSLNNNTIELSYHLPDIMRNMKTVPNELVIALGNRVLYDPAYHASRSIFLLPDGAASIIATQLEQLASNQERRSIYWDAFARLGDGSNTAIDQYINVLQDYKRFMGKEINRDVLDKKENEVSGAIIGLCRLGKKAEKAKEDLYAIIETGDHWTKPSLYTARALIEIVNMEEIKQRYLEDEKYKDSDRVGNEIKRAIQNKQLSEETGRNPCN